MTTPTSLLIYGNDAFLLETRRWVLEGAGFQVSMALGLLEAVHTLTTQRVDLFILCHSLSHQERENALEFSHQLRPAKRNIVLATPHTSYSRQENDLVLSTPYDPKTLVQAVEMLTQQQPQPNRDFSHSSIKGAGNVSIQWNRKVV